MYNKLHNTTNYEKYRLELSSINFDIERYSKYTMFFGFAMALGVFYHVTILTYMSVFMILLAGFINVKYLIADIVSIAYYVVVWIVLIDYNVFIRVVYTIACLIGALNGIKLISKFIRLNELKKEDGYPLFDEKALMKDSYIYDNYTAPKFRSNNMDTLENSEKISSKVNLSKKEKVVMEDVSIDSINEKGE